MQQRLGKSGFQRPRIFTAAVERRLPADGRQAPAVPPPLPAKDNAIDIQPPGQDIDQVLRRRANVAAFNRFAAKARPLSLALTSRGASATSFRCRAASMGESTSSVAMERFIHL
jgi:hypothetical protein